MWPLRSFPRTRRLLCLDRPWGPAGLHGEGFAANAVPMGPGFSPGGRESPAPPPASQLGAETSPPSPRARTGEAGGSRSRPQPAFAWFPSCSGDLGSRGAGCFAPCCFAPCFAPFLATSARRRPADGSPRVLVPAPAGSDCGAGNGLVLAAYRRASAPGARFPRSAGSVPPSRGLGGPGTAVLVSVRASCL